VRQVVPDAGERSEIVVQAHRSTAKTIPSVTSAVKAVPAAISATCRHRVSSKGPAERGVGERTRREGKRALRDGDLEAVDSRGPCSRCCHEEDFVVAFAAILALRTSRPLQMSRQPTERCSEPR